MLASLCFQYRVLEMTLRYSNSSGSKGYFRVHVGSGAGIDEAQGLPNLSCLLVTTFILLVEWLTKKKVVIIFYRWTE
jgi:hypothetical protein